MIEIPRSEPTIEFRPQPRQEIFLSSSADIAIYGGAAGGGKTWSLEVEPLRHIGVPGFGAVIFRRTFSEITSEGGLWDEAKKMYQHLGGKPNESALRFRFPAGTKIAFSHMQYEDDKYQWKAAQITLIEFDQLETFSESQFFYMLSRNRSMCGIRPYVRATANPEPCWLCNKWGDAGPRPGLLDWWIGDDGYAIPERSGIIRWMVRRGEDIHWAPTARELWDRFKIDNLPRDDPKQPIPKSVTFILSTVYDNQKLLEIDPGYLANLQALPLIDRERLLGDGLRGGNWQIKPAAGKIFNRSWFEIIDAAPAGCKRVRFWDLAATKRKMMRTKGVDPDSTAGVKMATRNGIYCVEDAIEEQLDPAGTDTLIQNTASQDGTNVAVRWEIEPGASGKRDNARLIKMLAGYDAKGIEPQGDKIMRAKPLAAQSEAGNVKLIRGEWNERWLNHMHGQPDLPHDDTMDASSGAFNDLADPRKTAGAW